jgi:DNA-binding SARP family transcriptional activator
MQALLAYLILHRRAPQSRQYISFLFWSNTSEKQALTNLRQLLHHLKSALPDHSRFLDIDHKTLQWKVNCPCIIDVAEFEKAIFDIKEASKKYPDNLGQLLESAVNWYKGELLPSCYDDWIIRERERLKDDFILVLEYLIKSLEEDESYPAAIRYAHRLIQEDFLQESVYCHLMRLHVLQNNRAGALRVFYQCTSILKQELGIKPGTEVQKVYKKIINDEAI